MLLRKPPKRKVKRGYNFLENAIDHEETKNINTTTTNVQSPTVPIENTNIQKDDQPDLIQQHPTINHSRQDSKGSLQSQIFITDDLTLPPETPQNTILPDITSVPSRETCRESESNSVTAAGTRGGTGPDRPQTTPKRPLTTEKERSTEKAEKPAENLQIDLCDNFSNWLEQLVQPKPTGPDPFPLRQPLKVRDPINFSGISHSNGCSYDFHEQSYTYDDQRDKFRLPGHYTQNPQETVGGLGSNQPTTTAANFKQLQVAKAAEIFFSEFDYFFGNSEKCVMKIGQAISKIRSQKTHTGNAQQVQTAAGSTRALSTGEMVLSKNNYNKMTKLIIDRIQKELKPLGKGHSQRDQYQRFKESESQKIQDVELSYYDINEMIKLPAFIQRLPPFLQVKLSLLATKHELDKSQILALQKKLEDSKQHGVTPPPTICSRNQVSGLTNEVQATTETSDSNKITTTPREDFDQVGDGHLGPDQSLNEMSSGQETLNSIVSQESPGQPLAVTSNNTRAVSQSRTAANLEKFNQKTNPANRDDLPSKSDLYILYSLLARKGQIISLKAHFIQSVPSTLFLIAENIVFLNLSFNQISEIPEEFFRATRNLEVLQLRNNPIKKLVLAGPGGLKEGSNGRDRYPMRKLKVLGVSFCLLENLPENIEYCTGLTSLDLSYNKIEKLDGKLGQLTANLRDVDLSGNSLYFLPAEMLKLNLSTFKYADNFTNPIFWKNNSSINSSAKKLSHICYNVIYNYLDKDVSRELVGNFDKENYQEFCREKYVCSTCGRTGFGEKIKILRPCKSLWGRKLVPFVFECCSEKGTKELLNKEEIEC